MALLGSGKFTYEVSGADWGKLPEGWTYKEATAVAVDSRDNAYVFNRGPHPMIVLDPNGNVLRTWGEGVFKNPHGVCVGPDDSVYCVDAGDHTVRKFTPEGKLLMTLGTAGRPSRAMSGKPFNAPTHSAVDARNGELLVSDGYANARVHRYSPDGKYISSWGESGTGPGQFNIVHNIAVDRNGTVYIGDRENRRVQVFDTAGKFQTQFVNLSKAAAVCVDKKGEGLVYIGEYYGGLSTNVAGNDLGPRVTIMDAKGKLLARLGEHSYGEEPGRFYSPHGMDVDSRGNIYVAEVAYAEYGRLMKPPRVLRSLQKLVKKS